MLRIAVSALAISILALVLCSCTTIRSKTVAEDGSYHSQLILVPPFGKLEAGAASYSVEVTEVGAYRTEVGGSLTGADNTAQVEALKATTQAAVMVGVEIGKQIAAQGSVVTP